MQRDRLREKLDAIPRVPLAEYPTPLEPLPRLSADLNRPVWIKRDDQIGTGLGGNKTRKLEYLLAEAQQRGARKVATFGGLQSNHARLTAAAANRLGLQTHLFYLIKFDHLMIFLEMLFFGSLVILFYIYFGYPVFIFILARLKPWRVDKNNFTPRISILTTAYNEERCIEASIKNKLKKRKEKMQNMEFGLTLTALGMGGTLFILFLVGLIVDGLNKILLRGEKKEEGRG